MSRLRSLNVCSHALSMYHSAAAKTKADRSEPAHTDVHGSLVPVTQQTGSMHAMVPTRSTGAR